MSKYIIAHDLGTSGNKATLFNDEGRLIASYVMNYKTEFRENNCAEQNPSDWWNAIVSTTQALLKHVSARDIAGIALSGQMMGCLCIDKKGNPLYPHMLYCDQRAQQEEAFLKNQIDSNRFYAST